MVVTNAAAAAAATAVPDEVLLLFFESSTKALLELDCCKAFDDTCGGSSSSSNNNPFLTMGDGRKLLLNQQRSCLHRAVFDYQQEQHQKQIRVEDVQERLGKLKQEIRISPSLQQAMGTMDEAARLALCRVMLYSELHLEQNYKPDSPILLRRKLQTTGVIERSKLMEFIALCQTAVRWKQVQHHLQTGEPLFRDSNSHGDANLTATATTTDVQEEDLQRRDDIPSAMKFPQARLEHIQRCLSRAVGIDPKFMTHELKRIFFDKATSSSNEFSNDKEVLLCFEQLVSQMNVAVTNASLYSPEQLLLSDRDQGGVTRVVSVQFSEVNLGGGSGEEGGDTRQDSSQNPNPTESGGGGACSGVMSSNNPLSWRNVSTVSTSAPKQEVMQQQDDLSDEEKKRQLRLATEATRLQQSLLEDLLHLPPQERNRQLERAQQCSDTFVRQISTLPPGPERIVFLQSIDPETSRLLALHKLWSNHLANSHNRNNSNTNQMAGN